MVWVVESLIQARYELTAKLNVTAILNLNIEKTAGHKLFKEGKGIQDRVGYPTLSALIKE